MLRILDNIVPVNDSIIPNENKKKLLQFVDKITESIQQPSFNYSGENLAVSIETRNSSRGTEIKSFDMQQKIEIEFEDSNNDQKSEDDGFHPVSTFDKNQNEIKIISTAFKKDIFFSKQTSIKTTGKKFSKVGSFIMSASIKGQKIENLTVPIKLKFEVNESIYNTSTGKCSFWETG